MNHIDIYGCLKCIIQWDILLPFACNEVRSDLDPVCEMHISRKDHQYFPVVWQWEYMLALILVFQSLGECYMSCQTNAMDTRQGGSSELYWNITENLERISTLHQAATEAVWLHLLLLSPHSLFLSRTASFLLCSRPPQQRLPTWRGPGRAGQAGPSLTAASLQTLLSFPADRLQGIWHKHKDIMIECLHVVIENLNTRTTISLLLGCEVPMQQLKK